MGFHNHTCANVMATFLFFWRQRNFSLGPFSRRANDKLRLMRLHWTNWGKKETPFNFWRRRKFTCIKMVHICAVSLAEIVELKCLPRFFTLRTCQKRFVRFGLYWKNLAAMCRAESEMKTNQRKSMGFFPCWFVKYVLTSAGNLEPKRIQQILNNIKIVSPGPCNPSRSIAGPDLIIWSWR